MTRKAQPDRIRNARLADLEAVRDVFRRASLSNAGDRDALLANPEAIHLSDTAIREGRTRVVVTEGGSIIGFATTRSLGSAFELEDLFVHPDWRRRGVARALISDAVAKARRDGVNRLEVLANRHALAFYRAVGFTVYGAEDTQFGEGLLMHLES